jgi:hypothetical protein
MCSAKRDVRFTPMNHRQRARRYDQTATCETCKRRYGSLDFARIAYITLTSKPSGGAKAWMTANCPIPAGWAGSRSPRDHTPLFNQFSSWR